MIIIGISLLVYVGIHLFLNRTITGKAIRAGIEDVDHVEAGSLIYDIPGSLLLHVITKTRAQDVDGTVLHRDDRRPVPK